MVECSIVLLAHFNARVATVVTCLIKRNQREGHQQKICANTCASYVTVAIAQFSRRVSSLLNSLHIEKLYFTRAPFNGVCVVQPKLSLLEEEIWATRNIFNPFDKWILIAAHKKWLAFYIMEKLGCVHECYVAKVTDSSSKIRLLDDNKQKNWYLLKVLCPLINRTFWVQCVDINSL